MSMAKFRDVFMKFTILITLCYQLSSKHCIQFKITNNKKEYAVKICIEGRAVQCNLKVKNHLSLNLNETMAFVRDKFELNKGLQLQRICLI